MRIRELAVLGGSAWVATVLVVALASDLGAGLSVLLGLLGLLVVAALAALVGTTRALRRIEASAARAAKAPRRAPSAKATELASGPRWAALSRQITRTVDSAVGDTVDRELSRTFRQVEALHNLYAMIDIEHALPASRGWPASPTSCCSWSTWSTDTGRPSWSSAGVGSRPSASRSRCVARGSTAR